MIVLLDRSCTLREKTDVVRLLEQEGYRVSVAPLAEETIVGILGTAAPGLEERLARLPGVRRVDRDVPPYALVSRALHPEATTIRGPMAVVFAKRRSFTPASALRLHLASTTLKRSSNSLSGSDAAASKRMSASSPPDVTVQRARGVPRERKRRA